MDPCRLRLHADTGGIRTNRNSALLCKQGFFIGINREEGNGLNNIVGMTHEITHEGERKRAGSRRRMKHGVCRKKAGNMGLVHVPMRPPHGTGGRKRMDGLTWKGTPVYFPIQ
jgi:hypothetical protein